MAKKPEDGIRSSGALVADKRLNVDAGNQTQSSARPASAVIHRAISPTTYFPSL